MLQQPSLLTGNVKWMSLFHLNQLGITVIVNWLQNMLFFVSESTSILLLLVRQCVQHVCASMFRLKPYPEFLNTLDIVFLSSSTFSLNSAKAKLHSNLLVHSFSMVKYVECTHFGQALSEIHFRVLLLFVMGFGMLAWPLTLYVYLYNSKGSGE